MLRTTLIGLILTSLLFAQEYRWPIRSSESLSATFAEYRSGHLHAGIDIKTWGEMEVPCLAIGDGYIERIVVGYNGYGRGLWIRLKDGNVAVYGHLEQFTPILENLVRSEQQANHQYYVRKKFLPDQYPVKAGTLIGYSGTSGTEHPHLHFEIRDSLYQVKNPQIFYRGVKDNKIPVLDEIMLIPMGRSSRIDGSAFPVIFDTQEDHKRVSVTGPFRVAINTHDRADGTYNKYNVYHTELLVNDSLRFEREFDQSPMRLMDERDLVYPGMRGKRKWRFTSLYNLDLEAPAPFVSPGMSGIIEPAGLSDLKIRVSDIKGNTVSKGLIFHEQVLASWHVRIENDKYLFSRTFPDDGYENIQFYTGTNSYIPVAETLYRLNSTTWVLGDKDLSSGVRALGSAGGKIKWILPPENQKVPEFEVSSGWIDGSVVFRLKGSGPFVFPITYKLHAGDKTHTGEIVQTGLSSAELSPVPNETAALAESIDLILRDTVLLEIPLNPMDVLIPGSHKAFTLPEIGVELSARNNGNEALFIRVDTTSASFGEKLILGLNVLVLHNESDAFSGTINFSNISDEPNLAIYTPGKKKSWKRLIPPDSTQQLTLDIAEGGRFFLIADAVPPAVIPKKSYSTVRRGQRMVFNIRENTRVLSYPKTGIKATLDGKIFFPDYNPLRRELSFHVPSRLGSGQHIFKLSISDGSGNTRDYTYPFTVRS